MQISELTVRTPNYVLMDTNGRIRPNLTSPKSWQAYAAIYGFSDKARYDEFTLHNEMKLVPYPLVKGYLQNQVDSAHGSLKLVVIDSVGLDEPALHTVTMGAVLMAQENKTNRLTASHRLGFDQKSNTYSVTKILR